MNKIQKQVYDKAQEISIDIEHDWIECFDKIVYFQHDTIPKEMIDYLDHCYDDDFDIAVDCGNKLIGELITFDPKLIQNRTLRKEIEEIYFRWCISIAPLILFDDYKLKSKAKTIETLEDELFLKGCDKQTELLEQFQYDEYIMKKYPKKIRDIISVTGYAKALTDDEDIELDFKIIDTIEYKIIKTHPDKKLQKQWFDKNDFIHECGMTRRFIEEHMMEKKQ